MSIDPLSDVLSLLRPHTYIAGGLDLSGKWSIAFDPHTGIKCYAVLSGACWLVVEDVAQAVEMQPGACVLLPYGRRFHLTNDLALAPKSFKETREFAWRGGIATLNGGGETLILGGHFAFMGSHADVLLGAMPPVTYLCEDRDKDTLRWALERMRQELVAGEPGGVLVAQHLAHLMLVQALRLYLAGAAGHHVGWLFALGDPHLAAAIGAMHAEPATRWTLAALAKKAGMSRASFAQQFTEKVGTSPIDYLTKWRMLLAANHLTQGNSSLAELAASLGYDSKSAFGAAFRRVMGCSPREYAHSVPTPDQHIRWGPEATQGTGSTR